MKRILLAALAAWSCLAATASLAQNVPPRQNHDELRTAAAQFLKQQAVGLPGDISVTVVASDSRVILTACPTPEPFLPRGGRAWGKTTVGVRCTAPSAWTVYLKGTVKVQADYIAAAVPIAQGQIIAPQDITRMRGDLTSLPPGVVTNPAEAVGRKAAMAVALGGPLRKDLLRSQPAVQSGQTVRLVSSGPGFKVSTEGRAIGNASEGQSVQTRTASGQLVTGIARLGGIVEVIH